MTRDYVAEIVEARSLAQANFIFSQMENELSPLEVKELAPQLKLLPAGLRVQAALSLSVRQLEGVTAQPYRSFEMYKDARLFSDQSVPREQKSLVLAFAGTSGRVMMPMSVFAQLLPADRFDILLLADRNNESYANGIEGVRAPFWQFATEIARVVKMSRYASLYTFGTSMGALPALRAGRLLGAKRAIGVGAVFPWHINLLQASHKPHVPAFDSLCSCGPGQDVDCVAAFSAGFERDRVDAERLARMAHVRLMGFKEYANHNLIYLLYVDGALPAFLGQMLDFDVAPATYRVPTWIRLARQSRKLLHRTFRRLRRQV